MKRRILILFLSTVQFFNSIGFLILPAFGNVKEVQPPLDSKVSEDKKTFFSGSLLQPGTYFAGLTVRDKTGQIDTAYTESVTVTYPHQMVIVFATTDPSNKKIYEASESLTPEGFPVMFKSKITGNYKTIAYKWDFGDGACQQTANGAYPECFEPNPTHNYFDGKKSFGGIEFKDRKSITPKLTVNAVFGDGRTETWDASAGTITFNTEPQFILVDLMADNYSGIAPFTVNLMIDPATARVVNATPTKYELDWGDGSEVESETISQLSAPGSQLNVLLSKSFTHTYTVPDTYNPKLTIYVSTSSQSSVLSPQSLKSFVFNVGDVTVGASGIAGDDISGVQDGFTIEKEQGESIDLKNEVIKDGAGLIKSLKWRAIDSSNTEYGSGVYSVNSDSSNISVGYDVEPGTYKLQISKDALEKNFNIIVKDKINPVIDNLNLDFGNTLSIGDEVGFHIEGSDNASLMSLNYYLINKSNNSQVFSGHEDVSVNQIVKDITFTLPENIQEGDYSLKVELIDKANNITTSLKDFNSDISVIQKDVSEQNVLATGISIFESSAGYASPAGGWLIPAAISLAGLEAASKLFDKLLKLFEPDFDSVLKEGISDFNNDYLPDTNTTLCNQLGMAITNIESLGDIASDENTIKAANFLLKSSSSANKTLNLLNYNLKKDGRFENLNTQGANVTVNQNSDDKLTLIKDGDQTDSNPKSFYLPHYLKAIKSGVRGAISSRAHLAASTLLNDKDLNSYFDIDVSNLSLSQSPYYKLLNNSYNLIEKSYDTQPELIKAFLNGELADTMITRLSDLNDSQLKEKKQISFYTQRLLQDLGISGPTDGTLTSDQLSAISTISKSGVLDLTPSDLIKLKDLSSKARGVFIGIRDKNIIVTDNRESGYSTFIGSLAGLLISGLPQGTLTYKSALNTLTTSTTNNDLINTLINTNAQKINDETLTNVSNLLPDKIITLISTLLPGERRSNAISALTQIITNLKNYSSSNPVISSNFDKSLVLLKSYSYLSNEDDLGILINKPISNKNVYKRDHDDDFDDRNISEIISVKQGIPLSLLLSITSKLELTFEDRAKAIALAARAVGVTYSKSLSNDPSGAQGLLVNKFTSSSQLSVSGLLKMILKETNSTKLQRLVNNLEILSYSRQEADLGDNTVSYYPITAKTLSEFGSNNTKDDFKQKLKDKIKTDLYPTGDRDYMLQNNGLYISVYQDLIDDASTKFNLINAINEVITLNNLVDPVRLGDQNIVLYNGSDYAYYKGVITVNSTSQFGIIIPSKFVYSANKALLKRKNIITEFNSLSESTRQSLEGQNLILKNITDPITIYGGIEKCELPSGMSGLEGAIDSSPEITIKNPSFKFTVDTLGAPASLLLMSSVSLTTSAPGGINGIYTITNPATGAAYDVSFSITESISAGTIREIPIIEIIGDELTDLLLRLGVSTLEGLKFTLKVAKKGFPYITIASGVLHAEPAGLEEAKLELSAECLPLTQTITQGENASIQYFANPPIPLVNLSYTSSFLNIPKPLKQAGVLTVKPIQDASYTFTASLEEAMSSSMCEVKVLPPDKKPGRIEVNIDERIVKGFSVKGLQIQRNYPVEYIISNSTGAIIANGKLDFYKLMSDIHTVQPEQEYKVTLKIGNLEVGNQKKYVAENQLVSYSYTGGVWRKYMDEIGKNLSITNNSIKVTSMGDLGTGAYVTNLAERPYLGRNPGTKRYEICRLLRIFKLFNDDGSPVILSNETEFNLQNPNPGFEEQLLGDPVDPKYLFLDRITTYVDYYLGENSTNRLYENYDSSKETLKYQFMIPSAETPVLNLGSDINNGVIINGR